MKTLFEVLLIFRFFSDFLFFYFWETKFWNQSQNSEKKITILRKYSEFWKKKKDRILKLRSNFWENKCKNSEIKVKILREKKVKMYSSILRKRSVFWEKVRTQIHFLYLALILFRTQCVCKISVQSQFHCCRANLKVRKYLMMHEVPSENTWMIYRIYF